MNPILLQPIKFLTKIKYLEWEIKCSGLCSKEEYKINEFSCSTHLHNYYLQILSENGIIGFLIISICYNCIIYKKEFLQIFL